MFCGVYFGSGRFDLENLLAQKDIPVSAAMVIIHPTHRAQADLHAIVGHLDVDHSKLRAAQAGVRPGDLFDLEQLNIIYLNAKALSKVFFGLYHQRIL